MTRTTQALAALVLMCATAIPALAQPTEGTTRRYGQSIGGQVLVTNSGFGVGVHLRLPIRESTAVTAEISLSAVKDEREIAFFDRFDRRDIPNKSHYLLLMPVHFGVEWRLFSQRIEDNFRPFVLAMVGPTLGWVSPYFEDANQNGFLDGSEGTYDPVSALPKGAARFGLGGRIAVGAHFGRGRRSTQGVRIGYAFTRLGNPVQLLESETQPARHFFGTPEVQLYFARLW